MGHRQRRYWAPPQLSGRCRERTCCRGSDPRIADRPRFDRIRLNCVCAGSVGLMTETPGSQSPTMARSESMGMGNGKRDYCNKPFRVGVALGESTTAGGTATSRELTWVSRLAELINESQLEPIHILNSGIGGNLISSKSASYEKSGKPSAMER